MFLDVANKWVSSLEMDSPLLCSGEILQRLKGSSTFVFRAYLHLGRRRSYLPKMRGQNQPKHIYFD